jgi:hypothetical protein
MLAKYIQKPKIAVRTAEGQVMPYHRRFCMIRNLFVRILFYGSSLYCASA